MIALRDWNSILVLKSFVIIRFGYKNLEISKYLEELDPVIVCIILMVSFVSSLQHQFPVCNDMQRAVYCIVSCGWGVWISLQSSAVVKLYHATTYESLCDIDVTQTVHKMLAGKAGKKIAPISFQTQSFLVTRFPNSTFCPCIWYRKTLTGRPNGASMNTPKDVSM